MAAPSQSVCSPWATEADLPVDHGADPAGALTVADCLLAASDVLFNLTRRRWPGSCSATIRPVGCDCRTVDACACLPPHEVILPTVPVTGVTEVKVDGAAVDPGRYRVDDYARLVLVYDEAAEPRRWPCCQRLDLPDTEPGTFSVTYAFGTPPPIGGRIAAAALGLQLALSATPAAAGACRLPKRITTITRQGVSMAVLDPMSLFEDGLTGLAEVDMWVQSVNVGDRRRRAVVIDPQSYHRARRAGT